MCLSFEDVKKTIRKAKNKMENDNRCGSSSTTSDMTLFAVHKERATFYDLSQ